MPPFIVLKKLLQRIRTRTRASKNKFSCISPENQSSATATLNTLINPSQHIKTDNTECLCRVCLKEGSKYIFDYDGTGTIAEKITEHAYIFISEQDKFPKHICESCHSMLQAAILFKSIAQESEKNLQEADRKLRETRETFNSDAQPYTETKYEPKHIYQDEETTSLSDGNTTEKADTINELNPQLDRFKCKKCSVAFKNIREYKQHCASWEHKRSRVSCPLCGVTVTSFYLKTHTMRRHTNIRPYVCEVCGKSFVTKSSFETHALQHTEDFPQECPDCPYRTRSAQNLSSHRRVHSDEKRYACAVCPLRTRTKSNFNKHMRTHTKLYTHKCGDCGKGFYAARELAAHRTIHTGLKEYKCDICGKEFGHKKGLFKHKRRVHHVEKGRPGQLPLYLKFEKKKLSEQRVEDEEICNTKVD